MAIRSNRCFNPDPIWDKKMQTPINTNSPQTDFLRGVAATISALNGNAASVKTAGVLYIVGSIVLRCLWSTPLSTLAEAICMAIGVACLLSAERIEECQVEMTLARLAP